MKPLRIVAQARRELRAAAVTYDLGEQLLESVRAGFRLIQRGPGTYPFWKHELPYQRYLVPRFKFSIFYRELETEIVVLAIAHPKRRPGYWMRRDRTTDRQR